MSMNLGSQSNCNTKKMQIHLILVGLLSSLSLGLSQLACKPTIQPDVDFPDFNSGFGYSPDAEHCQKLCTQDPRCRIFTFIREESTLTNVHYQCIFKFTDNGEPGTQGVLNGVTSGYSLKPCPTEDLLCLSKVYPSLEFLGTNYTSLVTATSEECQRVCTRDPFCQFFTYVNESFTKSEERYKCHLKYSMSIPRAPSVVTLADVVSGYSNKSNIFKNFTNACESTFFPDTEIQGNSFQSLPAASAENCQALCSAHPCCTYFSYENATFTCNMKNNTDELITQAKTGFYSGLPVYECLMDSGWLTPQYTDVDFFGFDIEAVKKESAAECQEACDTDRNCQFYSYVKDSFVPNADLKKDCNLKRVITMPAPENIQKVDNVVSGFSLNICV